MAVSQPYTRPIRSLHNMESGVTYEIPLDPGFVYVILDMDCFIAGVGGGAIQVNDSNLATFWFNLEASVESGTWMQWLGHQAFLGPDSIFATATVSDPFGHADLRITGYVLTEP